MRYMASLRPRCTFKAIYGPCHPRANGRESKAFPVCRTRQSCEVRRFDARPGHGSRAAFRLAWLRLSTDLPPHTPATTTVRPENFRLHRLGLPVSPRRSEEPRVGKGG